MLATRALRQAAHAAERVPLIRFVGKRHDIPGKFPAIALFIHLPSPSFRRRAP